MTLLFEILAMWVLLGALTVITLHSVKTYISRRQP